MKKFATWSGALALLASLLVAACGGSSGSGDTAQLRVINATQTHATLNLLVNGTAAISNVTTTGISAYSGVASGSPTIQLNDATSGAVLATTAPTLVKDTHSTLLAYEVSGVVRLAFISEETTAPAAGVAIARIFDAAPDAGALDIFITDPSVDITTTSPNATLAASTQTQTSNNITLAPGTFRVRVTGQGNAADLRLDIPSVVVTSQQILTIFLTPSVGGTLVNGGALLQQNGYAPTLNTNARARLLADVGGSATVAANVGGTTLSSGTVSPAVGAYAIIPATTTTTTTVTVNGIAVAAPALPAPGSDSTLVVYGNSAGTATATFIADDNHLPTTTTALKIRLFNGLTGATTPLTLSADFLQIAVGIQPGKASGYSTITPSTTLRLEVMSNSGTVYVETLATPPTNAVYTLFLLGDASNPVHLLRRDH